MAIEKTDFGKVADDLRRAATSFALLTNSATAFGYSINSFREFNRQLVATNAIALGNVQTFNKMEKSARSFALATTTSATEAAASLQNLAQAGFTATESVSAMTGVLLLASATLSDVNVSADLISSNIRAFGLQASDATRVSNLFTAAITSSLASVDKLTYALRQVAPVANVANLSIEETTAWLSILYNVGLRGEQAGTALRNVIVRLVRPTGESAAILRKLGVATIDATGNMRDLHDILRELDQLQLGEATLAKIAENEALAGMVTMMKATRVEAGKTESAYNEMLTKISGTQSAIELALANLESFDGSMRLLQNSVTDVAMTLGEEFAPYIRAVADYIRDLLQTFRELDPETRKFYLQVGTIGLALISTMAAANAFIIMFKDIGRVMYALSFGAALGGFNKISKGFKESRAAGVGFFSYMLPSLVSFTAKVGEFAAKFGNAMRAAALSLSLLGFNPVIAGLTALVAALGLATLAYKAFTKSTAEAAAEQAAFARAEAQRAAAREQFQEKAANIGLGEYALEDLGRQTRNARALVSSDLINTIGENDFVTAINSAQAGQLKAKHLMEVIEDHGQAMEETMGEARYWNDRISKSMEAARTADDSFLGKANRLAAFLNPFDDFSSVTDELTEILEKDYAAQKMSAELYAERKKQLLELQAEQENIIELGNQAEKQNIERYIKAIAMGDATLDPIYADYAEALKDYFKKLPEKQRKAMVEALAEGNDPFTQEKLLEAALIDQGVEASVIADVLKRREKERVRKHVHDLSKIGEELEDYNQELRVAALKYSAKNNSNLVDALRDATAAANLETVAELKETFTKFGDDYGTAIMETITQGQEGVQPAITAALENMGYLDPDKMGLDQIFSGEPFLEALSKRLKEDTTPEQAKEIITEEAKRFAQALNDVAEASILAMGSVLSDEQADEFRRIAKLRSDAIVLAANNAVDSILDAVDDTRKRVKREQDRLEREAREALRDARRLEDAFLDIAKKRKDTAYGLLDNTRGTSIATRVQNSMKQDIELIERAFDEQILGLQRDIEDIEVNFKGSPDELERLKNEYSQLTVEINAAKEAEIAAASSFTAQMERRSKALQLFKRDLLDIGIASKDTFTQVGAGIASAFAEYQDDLVTLIDITKDATTELLDTITTGIGDFIFDNTNAWENFKKSMLNISRQIFEGFTKALLQQTISSLTGGEGSILGNALQPSPYGKEGTPGVGTGGLLGRLFPGLAGAFGDKKQGATELYDGTTKLQTVLAGVSSKTDAIYNQHLTQLQGILSSFASGLQTTLSTATGSGITEIGTSLTKAADTVTAGAASAASELVKGVTTNITGALDPSKLFTASSVNKMTGVDTRLVEILSLAKKNSGINFEITEGLRSLERQKSLLAKGASQTLKSKHLTGNALDVVIKNPDGSANWDFEQYRALASHAKTAAGQLGYGGQFTWGGDWKSLRDGPHFQTNDSAISKYTKDMTLELQGATEQLAEFSNTDLPNALNAALPDLQNSVQQPVGTTFAEGGTIPGIPGVTTQPQQPQQQAGGLAGVLGGQGGDPNSAILQSSQQLAQVMQQFVSEITNTLNQFGSQFSQALNNALTQMGASGGVGFGGITGGLGGGLGGLGGLLGGLFGFAKGGYTGNGGVGEPAGIVHGREFVANAKATKEFYPLLEAINSGNVKPEAASIIMSALGVRKSYTPKRNTSYGYAEGGLVTGDAAGLTNALLGSRNNTAPSNVTTKEQPIYLNATYNIRGDGTNPDKFARSANQHAKRLMSQIERAKRNT